MNKGIYPALSGGVAYEKLLSIIANNVANINTAGIRQTGLSSRLMYLTILM